MEKDYWITRASLNIVHRGAVDLDTLCDLRKFSGHFRIGSYASAVGVMHSPMLNGR
jgi:hypothetical protein